MPVPCHAHNRADVMLDPQHIEEARYGIPALCAPQKVFLKALKAFALVSLGSLSCHGCEGLVLQALLRKRGAIRGMTSGQ